MVDVTDKQVEELQLKIASWAGDSYTTDDWTQILAEIALGAYPIKTFIEEVTSYSAQ